MVLFKSNLNLNFKDSVKYLQFYFINNNSLIIPESFPWTENYCCERSQQNTDAENFSVIKKPFSLFVCSKNLRAYLCKKRKYINLEITPNNHETKDHTISFVVVRKRNKDY